ncbi:MAG: 30S ribosomal protein S16 [Bacteroidetes bacterium]|nr:30S ribosomal protein S16 [Bacteroidota bacterium]MBU1581101.1 30S ribosomal protein S16 [Bacteroidota bacterium]
MPARIRLQRQGKKGSPFYHIVIADGRAPRDGRFIEKIGTYNPITNPAEIVLDFDKALNWLQNGAQPSDTARAILSYKGVMHKLHLTKGVAKGALTPEQAEVKFQTWLKEKEDKIQAKKQGLSEAERVERKKILESEVKIKEDRATELAKKRAAELQAEKDEAAEAAKEEAAETAAKEAPVAAKEEAPEAVKEEAPVAAKEEAPEAVKEEAPKAAKEEAPEAVKEEAPKAAKEEAPEAVREEAPAKEEAPAEESPKKDKA